MTRQRIVPVADLPESLWDGTILRLPPCLAAEYRDTVTRLGLAVVARSRDQKKSPIGGKTEEEARTHFAQAFDGSAARSMLTLIDPHNQVPRVADALAELFAGEHVAVLDAPCGAGAFFLSILATLAELRAAGVLPRHPLHVSVLGGDINDTATTLASTLHKAVERSLESQAIFVAFEHVNWDVCCPVSTAGLNNRFATRRSSGSRALVAVSNFSGFLTSSGNQKRAERQLEELFRYSAGENTSAIWIEPQTNSATNNLFSWLQNTMDRWFEHWTRRAKGSGLPRSEKTVEMTSALYELPLTPGGTSTVHLAVERFNPGGADAT